MASRLYKYAHNGSATKKEVDAYLRALEYEFSQGCEHMSERSGNEHRGKASNRISPADSSTFLWGLVVITAGCFWLLAKIILKALN